MILPSFILRLQGQWRFWILVCKSYLIEGPYGPWGGVALKWDVTYILLDLLEVF